MKIRKMVKLLVRIGGTESLQKFYITPRLMKMKKGEEVGRALLLTTLQ